jgi:hypothetical protein
LNLFFMDCARQCHNEKWTDKSVEAIKNSADDVPEGKSTILDAPMCNGGLVSQFEPFMSGQISTR